MKRSCIFCGSDGKLSNEHIISKWIQKHVPKLDNKSTGEFWEAKSSPMQYSNSLIAGDPLSMTRRIVCERECNNGWMSTIVKESQPDLEPLLYGDWGKLTVEGQLRIAKWAILTALVMEKTLQEQVTEPAEYRHLYNDKHPSAGWRVWIGVASEDTKTIWQHRLFESDCERYALIISCLFVGRLVFMVAGTKPPPLLNACRMPAGTPLMEIFPSPTAGAAPPSIGEDATRIAMMAMAASTNSAVSFQRMMTT